MRIGFVCMPASGHLNPMIALARKLQSRGHAITFISVLDTSEIVRAANLDFFPLAEAEYPSGSMTKPWSDFSNLRGLDANRYWFQNFLPGLSEAGLKYLPEILEKKAIEALVFDTSYRNLELVPMRIDMPYVQVWNALPFDFTGASPLVIVDWPYDPTPEGFQKNLEELQKFRGILAPVQTIATAYAEKVGLQIDWSVPAATASKHAIISQTPREFDFPGINRPPQFHYTGPFHDNMGRTSVPFAWEKLTGEPMIYASLGTLVNGLEHVYKTILEAVGTISGVQMVLTAGRNVNPDHLGPIPPNTIVVSQAPQIELLKRAALCITHAGLNTTLEALTYGVPVVALPIAFDQPGIASRIAYHGVGEFLKLDDLGVDPLSNLIQKVRTNSRYKNKALYFQDVIAKTRGLDVAADVIEDAFSKALMHARQSYS